MKYKTVKVPEHVYESLRVMQRRFQQHGTSRLLSTALIDPAWCPLCGKSKRPHPSQCPCGFVGLAVDDKGPGASVSLGDVVLLGILVLGYQTSVPLKVTFKITGQKKAR